MNDDLEVLWRGTVIGTLQNPIPDMWYLEGSWLSLGNNAARQFEVLAQQFEAQAILKDPGKSTRIMLQSILGDEPIHALVLSLEERRLLVRRYAERQAVAWLLANVP